MMRGRGSPGREGSRMEDELSRKIRAYVNGEAGAEIFDARDRRHIRVLLKEH